MSINFFDKLRLAFDIFRSSLNTSGFDATTSRQLNSIGKRCIPFINETEREDLLTEHLDSFIGHMLGVFSGIVSYHEAISYLCLSQHSLNSSILLRSQLEACLIFSYFTTPKYDLEEVERRVDEYRDWVMIRMFKNSEKSKEYDLFTLSPHHEEYLKDVELNYEFVKAKYADDLKTLKRLTDATTFLRDKRKVAKDAGIEDIYLGIFSETSASVHMADISDRMTQVSVEGYQDFVYEFRSNRDSMMIMGNANILLVNSISAFCNFFDLSKSSKKQLYKDFKLAKKHFS